mgnify:CR=1 FL=1
MSKLIRCKFFHILNTFCIQEVHIILGITIQEIICTYAQPEKVNQAIGLFSIIVHTWNSSCCKRAVRAEVRELIQILQTISQTLVTKILLGTLCCIPAYDTYFCNAIKGKFNDFYDDYKIMNLLNFISENQDFFKELSEELSEEYKTDYPLMKIVDMAYFTIGYDQALDKETRKKEKIKNEQ